MEQEAPELIIGPLADQFLSKCATEEQQALTIIFFSLLLDPSPDNINKFEADYFPYTGTGVIEYLDEDWYVSYIGMTGNPVHILRIFRRKDLPRPSALLNQE